MLVSFSFVIFSSSIGALVPQGLPNITGSYSNSTPFVDSPATPSGCFIRNKLTENSWGFGTPQTLPKRIIAINAAYSSNIYGASTNVTPTSIRTAFYIKY